MNNNFREAEEAFKTAQREYSAVNSLNQAGVYAVVLASENAVRGIFEETFPGRNFPHDKFKPYHKIESHLNKLGILDKYSLETQDYIKNLTGLALDDVRYVETKPYENYTNPKSRDEAQYLINGCYRFLDETISLSQNPEILEQIRNYITIP